jgi:hypothetical protein
MKFPYSPLAIPYSSSADARPGMTAYCVQPVQTLTERQRGLRAQAAEHGIEGVIQGRCLGLFSDWSMALPWRLPR